jgi:DNA-binding transcriptional LysR family regulator
MIDGSEETRMNLRDFDLNLLVALDALLAERNVTHAGNRLNLSQSAMSGALARLRDFFQDELLVPVGRRMVLTPLADDLVQPVRDLLVQVQTIGTKPRFAPATSDRHFSIAVSDYMTSVLMVDLLRCVKVEAPGITFELRTLGDVAFRELDGGQLDFLIGPIDEFLSNPHPREALFDDVFVCIVWTRNPHVGDAISLEQYLNMGHVAVRVVDGRLANHDEVHLRRMNHKRRVEVQTPAFDLAPQLIVGTDRLATVPARLARKYAKFLPIRMLALPVEIPPLHEQVQWHRAHDRDPGHLWLREQLRAAVARLDDVGPDFVDARTRRHASGHGRPLRHRRGRLPASRETILSRTPSGS